MLDHHGSPWVALAESPLLHDQLRGAQDWRKMAVMWYKDLHHHMQSISVNREREIAREMIIITIYRYRYMYICMYIHVLVRRGYTCINLPGYLYIYNLAGNLGAMYELSDLRSLSRHSREKHFEASGKLKLQWQLMTLRSFSIWTFDVQRIDVTCKVVPPVISWFISPLTIDISPINHSYWSYKPT